MKTLKRDSLPTDMPTTNRPQNDGASINDDTSRLDGVAKVTGAAKYGRDMYLDNQLFVGFIRCPWGKASLTSIDEDAAKKTPGVLEINMTRDSATYHGQNVGYIVAESKTALRRAMRNANAQWKRDRDIKTTITDSIDGPPEVGQKVRKELRDADHVLTAEYSTPVQTHSSLETHGVTVEHDGERAIVYASTQGTFSVADGMGDPLGLSRSNFEVRCEYVGGGFGSKFGAGKEGITAGEIAAKYKRPVMLFVDRDEEHLDTGNRPSARCAVVIGVKNDGKIVGGHIQTWGGVGVGGGGGGVRFPSGRYPVFNTNCATDHQDIQFNGGAPRAMRAPGWPQGAFVEELVIDELAAMIGKDPLEYRLGLDQEEHRRAMYEQGADLIGWDRRQKNGSQSGVVKRGFGMGSTSSGAFPARAEAEVVIHRDGSVECRTGTQDIGTGLRTIMAVLVADKLGVPMDAVNVKWARSTLPVGPASGGSMTSPNTSPAMMAATLEAKKKLLELVAESMNADANELEVNDGQVQRNGSTVMSFAEACRNINGDGLTGRYEWTRRDRSSRDKLWGEGHSHGAQFVDLSVDTETGVIRVNEVVAIQACGQVICRKTAESQIIGGVIQGISYALFEDKLLDQATGAMVNPNLEMYKIVGPDDMPHIRPVLWKRGQTGVRALGEPPVIPTAGACACALYNAIGAPVRHLPLTPDKVLAAIGSKGGAS